ncbi:MAG TPA: DUF924 family protein [Povalibacter sp.]|uniref:DUF924 family protein n=1 Tax=Povalibacter sp. TaxID=1962978 RepID=UPI002B614C0D|nr:DUF924 family protein [Povalibacter sp.]HMN45593.1 DUF924 family protein [Povalibacter sp.]
MTIAENRIEEVIRFWFDELTPQQWFVRDDAVDRSIRERFLPLYESVSAHPAEVVPTTARQALATVLVLDQLPRNLFRGSARAFATDARALAIAEQAVASGWDRELSAPQRMFLYMPFQHAEDREIQSRSVALFAALGVEQSLDYAHRHQEVIERFGRFPHRNAALGRESTREEMEFMKHHPGF